MFFSFLLCLLLATRPVVRGADQHIGFIGGTQADRSKSFAMFIEHVVTKRAEEVPEGGLKFLNPTHNTFTATSESEASSLISLYKVDILLALCSMTESGSDITESMPIACADTFFPETCKDNRWWLFDGTNTIYRSLMYFLDDSYTSVVLVGQQKTISDVEMLAKAYCQMMGCDYGGKYTIPEGNNDNLIDSVIKSIKETYSGTTTQVNIYNFALEKNNAYLFKQLRAILTGSVVYRVISFSNLDVYQLNNIMNPPGYLSDFENQFIVSYYDHTYTSPEYSTVQQYIDEFIAANGGVSFSMSQATLTMFTQAMAIIDAHQTQNSLKLDTIQALPNLNQYGKYWSTDAVFNQGAHLITPLHIYKINLDGTLTKIKSLMSWSFTFSYYRLGSFSNQTCKYSKKIPSKPLALIVMANFKFYKDYITATIAVIAKYNSLGGIKGRRVFPIFINSVNAENQEFTYAELKASLNVFTDKEIFALFVGISTASRIALIQDFSATHPFPIVNIDPLPGYECYPYAYSVGLSYTPFQDGLYHLQSALEKKKLVILHIAGDPPGLKYAEMTKASLRLSGLMSAVIVPVTVANMNAEMATIVAGVAAGESIFFLSAIDFSRTNNVLTAYLAAKRPGDNLILFFAHTLDLNSYIARLGTDGVYYFANGDLAVSTPILKEFQAFMLDLYGRFIPLVPPIMILAEGLTIFLDAGNTRGVIGTEYLHSVLLDYSINMFYGVTSFHRNNFLSRSQLLMLRTTASLVNLNALPFSPVPNLFPDTNQYCNWEESRLSSQNNGLTTRTSLSIGSLYFYDVPGDTGFHLYLRFLIDIMNNEGGINGQGLVLLSLYFSKSEATMIIDNFINNGIHYFFGGNTALFQEHLSHIHTLLPILKALSGFFDDPLHFAGLPDQTLVRAVLHFVPDYSHFIFASFEDEYHKGLYFYFEEAGTKLFVKPLSRTIDAPIDISGTPPTTGAPNLIAALKALNTPMGNKVAIFIPDTDFAIAVMHILKSATQIPSSTVVVINADTFKLMNHLKKTPSVFVNHYFETTSSPQLSSDTMKSFVDISKSYVQDENFLNEVVINMYEALIFLKLVIDPDPKIVDTVVHAMEKDVNIHSPTGDVVMKTNHYTQKFSFIGQFQQRGPTVASMIWNKRASSFKPRPSILLDSSKVCTTFTTISSFKLLKILLVLDAVNNPGHWIALQLIIEELYSLDETNLLDFTPDFYIDLCPSDSGTASTIIIDYIRYNIDFVISACNPLQMPYLMEFISTVNGTIFSVGVLSGGRCDPQIYTLSPTPYQLLNPFLFYAVQHWGTYMTYIYQEDSNTDIYLLFIKSICAVIGMKCFYSPINTISEITPLLLDQTVVNHGDSGFIVNALMEKLSDELVKRFADCENSNMYMGVIFPNSVYPSPPPSTTNQEKNFKRIFFLDNSFPLVLVSSTLSRVFSSILPTKHARLPAIYPRVSDSFKSILSLITTKPTSPHQSNPGVLYNRVIQGAHGSFSFDRSNSGLLPLYLAQYDNKNVTIKMDVSTYVPGNPLMSSLNIVNRLECDFTDSTRLANWMPQSVNLGLMVSLSGRLYSRNEGLLEIVMALVNDRNANYGGLNGMMLNLIVMDDRIEDKTTKSLAQALVNDFKVIAIWGLVDSSQKAAVLPMLIEKQALLFYFGDVAPSDCTPNVFYFGFIPSVLYTIPIFFMQQNIPTSVFFLGNLIDTSTNQADPEIGYLMQTVSRFGIEIVGMYQYNPSDLESKEIMSIVSKALPNGGWVVSLLRGEPARKQFISAKDESFLEKGIHILAIGVSHRDIISNPSIYAGHYFSLTYLDKEMETNTKAKSILRAISPSDKSLNNLQFDAYNSFQFYFKVVEATKTFDTNTIIKKQIESFTGVNGPMKMGVNHYPNDISSIYIALYSEGKGLTMENSYIQRIDGLPIYTWDPLDIAEYQSCDLYQNLNDPVLHFPLVKVGVMYDMTGMNSQMEIPVMTGVLSVIMNKNAEGGFLGKHIVPVVRDSKGNDPDVIASAVKEFISDPEITTLFACVLMSCRNAVAAAIQGSNLTLWLAAETPDGTCNQNTVVVGHSQGQIVKDAIPFMISIDLLPRVFILYNSQTDLADYFLEYFEAEFGVFGMIVKKVPVTIVSISDEHIYNSIAEMPPSSIVFLLISPSLQVRMLLKIRQMKLNALLQNYSFINPLLKLIHRKQILDSGMEGIVFIESYFPTVKNNYTTEFLRLTRHFSGSSSPSGQVDFGYSAANLWLAAVQKAGSFAAADVKKNLIDTTAHSAAGPITVEPSLHTSHYSYVGRMVSGNLVALFANGLIIRSRPFNWKIGDAGKICSWLEEKEGLTPTETAGVFQKDYVLVAIVLSLEGENAKNDARISYTINELLNMIEYSGGILGKSILPYFLNDNSDDSQCQTNVINHLQNWRDRVVLVLTTVKPACRSRIQLMKASFLIAAVNFVEGNTCDANILYYGTEPSTLERSFNIIFARGYSKILIIEGDLSYRAHSQYAYTYFSYLNQDVQIIGSISSQTDVLLMTASVLKRMPNGGAVLFFSYARHLTSFMKAMLDSGLKEPTFRVISYRYQDDINPYVYEAVGSYFTSIDNEENKKMLPILSQRLAIDIRDPSANKMSESYVNIFNVLQLWSKAAVATKSLDYDPILRYLRGLQEFMTLEGPISLTHANVVRRKLYFAMHRTSPSSNGGFDITYESSQPVTPKDYRLLEFNFVNYECIVSEEVYFHRTAKSTLTIYVIVPLKGTNRASGIALSLGVLAAIDQINDNQLLTTLLFPSFYSVFSDDEYISAVYSIMGSKDNLFIIGGTHSRTRSDVSSTVIGANVLFFYPGINIISNCYRNLITAGVSGNQITENALYALQSMTDNIVMVISALVVMKSYSGFATSFMQPAIESVHLNVRGTFKYDSSFSFSAVRAVIPEGGVIVSFMEDENAGFLKAFYDSGLKTPEFRIMILFPTVDLFSLDTKITEGHIASSFYFHKIIGTDIPASLQVFQDLMVDLFNYSTISSFTESAYVSMHLISNGLFVSNLDTANSVLEVLGDVNFEGPTGLVEISKNSLIKRRLFTVEFRGGDLYSLHSPTAPFDPLLNPTYTNLPLLPCDSSLTETKIIEKYILVLHEYSPETAKEESYISTIVQITIQDLQSNPELTGFALMVKDISAPLEEMQLYLNKYPDPVLVIGCTSLECRDIVSQHYEPKRILFFFAGYDDGSLCAKYTYFIRTEIHQRYVQLFEYLKFSMLDELILLYDSSDSSIYRSTIERLASARGMTIHASCDLNATNPESFSNCIAKLEKRALNSVDVTTVVSTVRPHIAEMLRVDFMSYMGLFSDSFIFAWKDCLATFWSTEALDMYTGSFCMTTLGSDQTIQSSSFTYYLKTLFDESSWVDEAVATYYTAIVLYVQAIRNSRKVYPQSTQWPDSDYVRMSLKEYNLEVPVGDGSFAYDGHMRSYFYLNVIRNGEFVLQYPLDELLLVEAATQGECSIGKDTVSYGFLIEMMILTGLALVHLGLISFFWTLIYINRDHIMVAVNAPQVNRHFMSVHIMLSIVPILFVLSMNNTLCYFRVLLIYVPICYYLSVLGVKANSLSSFLRAQGNKSDTAYEVQRKTLLVSSIIFMAIEAIILFLWFGVAKLYTVRILLDSSSFVFDHITQSCSTNRLFGSLQYSFIIAACVYGLVISFKARTIDQGDRSGPLIYTYFIIAIVATLIFAFDASGTLSLRYSLLLKAGGIQIGSMLSLIVHYLHILRFSPALLRAPLTVPAHLVASLFFDEPDPSDDEEWDDNDNERPLLKRTREQMAVDRRYKYLVFAPNNGSLFEPFLLKRGYWQKISSAPDPKESPKKKKNEDGAKPKVAKTYRELETEFVRQFRDSDFHFCWRSTLRMPAPKGAILTVHSVCDAHGALGPQRQLVNHFPSIDCLTTKVGILRSLRSFYWRRKERIFVNTPISFVIRRDSLLDSHLPPTEWLTFVNLFSCDEFFNLSTILPKYNQKHLWIVKPTGLNCGRGIKGGLSISHPLQVFDSVADIKDDLKTGLRHTDFVIQKYLECPLLIKGRKFDIRIWCLVTEQFDVYLYHEGYLRTSSELFTVDLSPKDTTKNQMVHLTNYISTLSPSAHCMQIKSENLGKFEEGNTLSFAQFQDYLNETFPDQKIDVYEHFMPRMRDLVIDSILSVKSQLLVGGHGRHSFELFGYDFMIDEDFRLWLIEVNTNPFLGVQNPWHKSLLEHMADDLIELAIDPTFPAIDGFPRYSKELPNAFELIYTFDQSKTPVHQYTTKRDLNWLFPVAVPEGIHGPSDSDAVGGILSIYHDSVYSSEAPPSPSPTGSSPRKPAKKSARSPRKQQTEPPITLAEPAPASSRAPTKPLKPSYLSLSVSSPSISIASFRYSFSSSATPSRLRAKIGIDEAFAAFQEAFSGYEAALKSDSPQLSPMMLLDIDCHLNSMFSFLHKPELWSLPIVADIAAALWKVASPSSFLPLEYSSKCIRSFTYFYKKVAGSLASSRYPLIRISDLTSFFSEYLNELSNRFFVENALHIDLVKSYFLLFGSLLHLPEAISPDLEFLQIFVIPLLLFLSKKAPEPVSMAAHRQLLSIPADLISMFAFNSNLKFDSFIDPVFHTADRKRIIRDTTREILSGRKGLASLTMQIRKTMAKSPSAGAISPTTGSLREQCVEG